MRVPEIPKGSTSGPYDTYSQRYGPNGPKPTLTKPVASSWLFEIVDSESGLIDKSFTLIMPPTGISIKEPQRVSITKTFGNAFVDDYGPDNLQITLKGFSGTAHVFPTFKTRGTSQEFSDVSKAANDASSADPKTGYSGRDAFYLFQKDIIRYKDRANWDKKELRVYDLADEQAYKCVLLDFVLDRNADQPINRYPFTISLFVYQRLEKYTPVLKTVNIAKNPTAALNKCDSLLDKVQDLYKDVQGVINQVYLLKAKVLELRTRYNKFLDQTTKILTSPLDIAKNLIDTAFSAMGIAYDTYRAGKYTLERYMQAEELFRSVLNEGLKIYGFQIGEGWQASRSLFMEIDDGVNVDSTVPSRNIQDTDYTFSGLSVYTVRGDDTLQTIASSQLGDIDLWVYIAAVNPGVNSNDDLNAGDTLYIPVQIETSEAFNKERFIMTEDVSRDPYGSDIRLDSDGNIIIQENGDVALISGADNVKQAVDLRLNTLAGSMITQTAFGITVQAGMAGSSMALRYLKMSIRATLYVDPRIESIDNLMVSIKGDTAYIAMDIRLIGAEQSIPVTLSM